MFSKSSNSPSAATARAAAGARNGAFSLIGGDVTVHGDILASADLHIDGRVDGNVDCAALVQGAESVIKGAVTARSARIGGTVEGAITAEELVVEATARITGDVTYGTISIAQGGQVAGLFARQAGQPGAADLKLVSDAG